MTQESPTVEPHKTAFAALLEKVKACPPPEATAKLPQWRQMLEEIWPKDTSSSECSECWKVLLEELPVPNPVPESPSPKDLSALLCPKPKDYRSTDVFLCGCAFPHFGDRIWSEAGGSKQVLFVAGCINLAILANRRLFEGISESLLPTLANDVSYYYETIVLSALESDQPTPILEKTGRKWRLAGVLDLKPNRRPLDQEDFLTAFQKHEHLLDSPFIDFISFVTGVSDEYITRQLLLAMVKNPDGRERLQRFWWEDADLSRALAELVATEDAEAEKKKRLRLWSHFLVPDDSFQFSWEVLFWVIHTYNHQETRPFGTDLDTRLRALRELLDAPAKAAFHSMMHPERRERDWMQSSRWRHCLAELFQALGSLIEEDRYSRNNEEHWIRQRRAIELLSAEPALIPSFINGVLTKAKEHWDLIDPIILGLPPEPTTTCLEQFASRNPHQTDARFHAERLLAHLHGEVPGTPDAPQDSGLLGAVENLIQVSRTKAPDPRARTWLGDAGLEALWLGAIQKAVAELTEDLEGHYGNEHKHVHGLATALARNLNQTNKTVTEWLRRKHVSSVFIQVSVREFEPTAPEDFAQEGGERGVQSDLALLLDCNVPGLMRAERVTLIQAKKLSQNPRSRAWASSFSFSPKDHTQLGRLLHVSEQAHYLFFIHPRIGVPSLMLPARTVKDSCAANSKPTVPLSVVRHGGLPIPEFLLYGIIGLWAGDDDKDLVKQCHSGAEIVQGPRVAINIKIRSENFG